MKIKAKYEKLLRSIRVELEVVDNEDYPTNFVFFSEWGEYDWYVTKEFDNAKEAQKWVEEKIQEVKETLEAWRKIELPPEKEYII